MKTDKEAAEEILADEFQANLKDTADLQLQVTLNPDVERIIRAMLKLCKHKEESRWIPVTERLPDEGEECLFSHNNLKDLSGNIFNPSTVCGFFMQGRFYSWLDRKDGFTATHWMPVPQLTHSPTNK